MSKIVVLNQNKLQFYSSPIWDIYVLFNMYMAVSI